MFLAVVYPILINDFVLCPHILWLHMGLQLSTGRGNLSVVYLEWFSNITEWASLFVANMSEWKKWKNSFSFSIALMVE